MPRKYLDQMVEELEYANFHRWLTTHTNADLSFSAPSVHSEYLNYVNRCEYNSRGPYSHKYWLLPHLPKSSKDSYYLLRRGDERNQYRNYHDDKYYAKDGFYRNRRTEARFDRRAGNGMFSRNGKHWNENSSTNYYSDRLSESGFSTRSSRYARNESESASYQHNPRRRYLHDRLELPETFSSKKQDRKQGCSSVCHSRTSLSENNDYQQQESRGVRKQGSASRLSDVSAQLSEPETGTEYASWYNAEEQEEIVNMLREVNLRHDRQLQRDIMTATNSCSDESKNCSSMDDGHETDEDENEDDGITVLVSSETVLSLPEETTDSTVLGNDYLLEKDRLVDKDGDKYMKEGGKDYLVKERDYLLEDDCLLIRERNECVIGEEGKDYLQKKGDKDCMIAEEGKDYLLIKGGKNCLIGEEGKDYLLNKGGKDCLIGEEGTDYLLIKGGKDCKIGKEGQDYLLNKGGKDCLIGKEGKEYLLKEKDNEGLLGKKYFIHDKIGDGKRGGVCHKDPQCDKVGNAHLNENSTSDYQVEKVDKHHLLEKKYNFDPHKKESNDYMLDENEKNFLLESCQYFGECQSVFTKSPQRVIMDAITSENIKNGKVQSEEFFTSKEVQEDLKYLKDGHNCVAGTLSRELSKDQRVKSTLKDGVTYMKSDAITKSNPKHEKTVFRNSTDNVKYDFGLKTISKHEKTLVENGVLDKKVLANSHLKDGTLDDNIYENNIRGFITENLTVANLNHAIIPDAPKKENLRNDLIENVDVSMKTNKSLENFNELKLDNRSNGDNEQSNGDSLKNNISEIKYSVSEETTDAVRKEASDAKQCPKPFITEAQEPNKKPNPSKQEYSTNEKSKPPKTFHTPANESFLPLQDHSKYQKMTGNYVKHMPKQIRSSKFTASSSEIISKSNLQCGENNNGRKLNQMNSMRTNLPYKLHSPPHPTSKYDAQRHLPYSPALTPNISNIGAKRGFKTSPTTFSGLKQVNMVRSNNFNDFGNQYLLPETLRTRLGVNMNPNFAVQPRPHNFNIVKISKPHVGSHFNGTFRMFSPKLHAELNDSCREFFWRKIPYFLQQTGINRIPDIKSDVRVAEPHPASCGRKNTSFSESHLPFKNAEVHYKRISVAELFQGVRTEQEMAVNAGKNNPLSENDVYESCETATNHLKHILKIGSTAHQDRPSLGDYTCPEIPKSSSHVPTETHVSPISTKPNILPNALKNKTSNEMSNSKASQNMESKQSVVNRKLCEVNEHILPDSTTVSTKTINGKLSKDISTKIIPEDIDSVQSISNRNLNDVNKDVLSENTTSEDKSQNPKSDRSGNSTFRDAKRIEYKSKDSSEWKLRNDRPIKYSYANSRKNYYRKNNKSDLLPEVEDIESVKDQQYKNVDRNKDKAPKVVAAKTELVDASQKVQDESKSELVIKQKVKKKSKKSKAKGEKPQQNDVSTYNDRQRSDKKLDIGNNEIPSQRKEKTQEHSKKKIQQNECEYSVKDSRKDDKHVKEVITQTRDESSRPVRETKKEENIAKDTLTKTINKSLTKEITRKDNSNKPFKTCVEGIPSEKKIIKKNAITSVVKSTDLIRDEKLANSTNVSTKSDYVESYEKKFPSMVTSSTRFYRNGYDESKAYTAAKEMSTYYREQNTASYRYNSYNASRNMSSIRYDERNNFCSRCHKFYNDREFYERPRNTYFRSRLDYKFQNVKDVKSNNKTSEMQNVHDDATRTNSYQNKSYSKSDSLKGLIPDDEIVLKSVYCYTETLPKKSKTVRDESKLRETGENNISRGDDKSQKRKNVHQNFTKPGNDVQILVEVKKDKRCKEQDYETKRNADTENNEQKFEEIDTTICIKAPIPCINLETLNLNHTVSDGLCSTLSNEDVCSPPKIQNFCDITAVRKVSEPLTLINQLQENIIDKSSSISLSEEERMSKESCGIKRNVEFVAEMNKEKCDFNDTINKDVDTAKALKSLKVEIEETNGQDDGIRLEIDQYPNKVECNIDKFIETDHKHENISKTQAESIHKDIYPTEELICQTELNAKVEINCIRKQDLKLETHEEVTFDSLVFESSDMNNYQKKFCSLERDKFLNFGKHRDSDASTRKVWSQINIASHKNEQASDFLINESTQRKIHRSPLPSCKNLIGVVKSESCLLIPQSKKSKKNSNTNKILRNKKPVLSKNNKLPLKIKETTVDAFQRETVSKNQTESRSLKLPDGFEDHQKHPDFQLSEMQVSFEDIQSGTQDIIPKS